MSNHYYTGAAIHQFERCTIQRVDAFVLINTLKEGFKGLYQIGLDRKKKLVTDRDTAWAERYSDVASLNKVMQSYTELSKDWDSLLASLEQVKKSTAGLVPSSELDSLASHIYRLEMENENLKSEIVWHKEARGSSHGLQQKKKIASLYN